MGFLCFLGHFYLLISNPTFKEHETLKLLNLWKMGQELHWQKQQQ